MKHIIKCMKYMFFFLFNHKKIIVSTRRGELIINSSIVTRLPDFSQNCMLPDLREKDPAGV